MPERGLYRRGDAWWIRFTAGGKQYRESAAEVAKELGFEGLSPKEAARRLLAKRLSEVTAGTFFPERKRTGLTVHELGERWLLRSKRKASISDDATRWKRVEAFFGPERLVSEIRTEDVIEFRDALLAEPVVRARRPEVSRPRKKAPPPKTMAPQTVDHHLILLGAALRMADKAGDLTRKPEVKLLGERNHRDERLCSDSELAQLLGEAKGELRLAIIIGRYSGMRLGEIVGLRWEQIDMKRGLVTLSAEQTKTREARRVPLGTPAVETLAALPKPLDRTARVFSVKDAKSMSPLFSRLTRKIGIRDLHFHDLRGTRLSELARAGAHVKQIQQISGHRKVQTLVERYFGTTEEELIEVARKAERIK